MSLLSPPIASCPRCPWEVACSSVEEKQRRERVHAERVHMAAVEAVTGLVANDPAHAADRETVERLIVADGRTHGGEVDPNRVRALVPSYVLPQVIGAVYNALLAQGRLVEAGWTTNTDRKGRNVGKPLKTYRLVDQVRAS